MINYIEMSDEELMKHLASICEALGWMIAIPVTKGSVPGLLIGNEEFITVLGDPVHDAIKGHYELDYAEDEDQFGFEVMAKNPKKPSNCH